MSIKQITANRVICSLLLVLCYLFVSCEQPADADDEYNNPNAGASRDGLFSHNSGLYAQQFSLTLKVPEGSTVYYSTDGSIPSPEKVGNGFVFKYTSPITIQNRNGQANVLATSANITQMNMVPNDPRGSVPQVYIPTDAQVPKATVIRAVIVDANGKKSDVVTKTYFFGNNLANYANNPVISIVTDPRNLVDRDIGIMVRGASSNRWESPPAPDVYNFQKKGQDWEREAYFELFEGGVNNRSVPLSTGVGIRVRGGWSRAAAQKSFTVYFREEYGINNLRNYNLIPGAVKADGTPVGRYKSFMLRNGANDGESTKFYDVFIQDLLRDRSFTAQAGIPCVVYLNGEYWGPYNLQERYSDNHTEYKYGVTKENVISYDNGELDDGTKADESLFLDMMNMESRNMSITANYNAFCNVFDIDNFIDYWAAQIYIYNEDWPQNNFRLWRTRTVEPGNPYGDTKWRWQMFDTEFAMGIYNGGRLYGSDNDKDAFDKILNGESKEHYNNKLFKALLANPDFCRKFVNTMMDLYNVNFHPDSFGPLLDKYANTYRPLMGDDKTVGTYFSRWGGWPMAFQNKVNDAGRYLTDIRNAMVNNYLPKYFNGYSGIANIGISSNNLRDVTISTTGVSGASIKINTVTPNFAGSWTGRYYSGNPITVTASAPPSGYEFAGWTITGGTPATSSTLTTTVSITTNAQITAKYKPIGSAVVPVSGITLNTTTLNIRVGRTSTLSAVVTPSNATYNTVIWTSSNSNVAVVDGSGKVTAVKEGTATITASTVEGKTAACTVTVPPPTVLLDLAAAIQNLAEQNINDRDKFTSVFSGIPVNAWPGENATYAIINEGGVKKIQVNEYAMWGPGLDITPNFNFQAGDRIDFKGKHLIGSYSDGIQIQKEFDDPWRSFYLASVAPGQEFNFTFTLTADDAAWFNANRARDGTVMKLRTNGKEPWVSPDDPRYQSGYVGSFVIEQFKVYRY